MALRSRCLRVTRPRASCAFTVPTGALSTCATSLYGRPSPRRSCLFDAQNFASPLSSCPPATADTGAIHEPSSAIGGVCMFANLRLFCNLLASGNAESIFLANSEEFHRSRVFFAGSPGRPARSMRLAICRGSPEAGIASQGFRGPMSCDKKAAPSLPPPPGRFSRCIFFCRLSCWGSARRSS
jgi:hypothetical protein